MTLTKFPREFEPLWVVGAKYPDEPMSLTYSKERGFFEVYTNKDAVPVIGEILSWQYRCHLRYEDDEAYENAVQLAAEAIAA